MENGKNFIINKCEWLQLSVLFIASALYGRLTVLNSSLGGPLKSLYYIMIVLGTVYSLYKLIKKESTVEKLWLLSGVFIVSQYAGIYSFERIFGFYDAAIPNILFHELLNQSVFLILYLSFLIYYIYLFVLNKGGRSNRGLKKTDLVVLLLLLLLPILRSLNLFIYGDIVDGAKNVRISVVSQLVFTDQMTFQEKMNHAEMLMERLMRMNGHIELIYKILTVGAICFAGIALLREKIIWQKYLALGGTFISVQYLGILYFDRLLGCVKDFYTSNLNMLYGIIMERTYLLLYTAFLFIYILKHYILQKKR